MSVCGLYVACMNLSEYVQSESVNFCCRAPAAPLDTNTNQVRERVFLQCFTGQEGKKKKEKKKKLFPQESKNVWPQSGEGARTFFKCTSFLLL